VCDINVEITSAQNPRFVLHDSMGFEPGMMNNFETAESFLKSRSSERVALKDRVHAIWCVGSTLNLHRIMEHNRLCIQVPHAGGRVFETGDEELLKLGSSIKGN
jgi:hypothetical protein